MLLSKRLKELRLKNNMTQRELGENINVTKVSICCYENDTRCPTLDTLTKLGEVLGVSVSYLMGYDEDVKVKHHKQVVKMAKEEIEFVMELRKLEDIHNLILENPKTAAELVSKRIEND